MTFYKIFDKLSSMNITLKNIQIYTRLSEETTAFNATIYLDDKKVGEVENEGKGGCNSYHWYEREVGNKIEDWAQKQPLEFDFDKLDQIIDPHLEKFEEEKQFKKWCKKTTVFRLKNDETGSWRTLIKCPFTLKVKESLIKKHGDKLEEILNERFSS